MPHANSRFSRPRATSPSASDGTLPCSAVRIAAISLRRWSTRLRILNMISVRFESDVARHAVNARCRGRDRRVNLLDRGEVDPLGLPPRRRVEHRPAPAGGALDDRAVDPVRNPAKLYAWLGCLNRSFGYLGHVRGSRRSSFGETILRFVDWANARAVGHAISTTSNASPAPRSPARR